MALTGLNVLFGEGSLVCFALLGRRRFSESETLILTLCYAVSPLLWFASDVQSSYIAAAFFAPLLFICFEDWDMFPLGCLLWAVMTGFRPSDGVFVIPWIAYQGLRRSWRTRLLGILAAVPGILAWWIPTALRFGDGLFSPLHRTGEQARSTSNGVLTGGLWIHGALGVGRVLAGMILGWGLLVPIVFWALIWRNRNSRPMHSVLIWVGPGLLFFMLYYIAIPIYLAYLIPAGFLAAGYVMEGWSQKQRLSLCLGSAALSLLFMFFARPVAVSNAGIAILDSDVLAYSRWGLVHQYQHSVTALMGVCEPKGILGTCMNAK
jgi:hypothetical protein